MRSSLGILALLPFLGPSPPGRAEEAPGARSVVSEGTPVFIGEGEQRLLRVSGLSRYSLGCANVRATTLPRGIGDRDHLLLKGVGKGTCDLWIWKSDGSAEIRSIQVRAWDSKGTPPALASALETLEEVEVLAGPEGFTLRGEIRTPAEAARVGSVASRFPRAIANETELSPGLSDSLLGEVRDWLRRERLAESLSAVPRDGRIAVGGSVSDPARRDSLLARIRARFPLVVTDIAALPDGAPTVFFRVFLLEVLRDTLTSFGMAWPETVEGAFHATSWAVRDRISIDLAVRAMARNGSARLLSRPEIAVRAPGEAELFAGGELPIRQTGRFHSNVSWRSFGLTLRLKVTHAAGDRLRLEIQTEMSHLDARISSDSVPGIRASRMRTQVDARYGEPLLLSGLLQQGVREEAKGLPLLHEVPVLGALFGSDDYLSERSELVAILVPEAAPPNAPMEKVGRRSPRGPAPPPRNWLSPEDERSLRRSPEYPWNALR